MQSTKSNLASNCALASISVILATAFVFLCVNIVAQLPSFVDSLARAAAIQVGYIAPIAH